MKKPVSRIREEIARLQEQLKHAETREAERIGRIAIRAGLGEIAIEEADLLSAFEDLKRRFRKGERTFGQEGRGAAPPRATEMPPHPAGAAEGTASEG